MTIPHILDVHNSPSNANLSLSSVFNWMDHLVARDITLPWETWFQRQDAPALEALCMRAFNELSSEHSILFFAKSMGFWKKKTLFTNETLRILATQGTKMPEDTWHTLVENHGIEVVLELLQTINRKHPEMLNLDIVLVKEQQELVALPLRLGMFDNDSLAQPYGLDGQSLEFWARRVAASGKNKSWMAFCTQYPWHGLELVQTLLQRPHLLGRTGTSFLETWMHDYPDQYRALHTFLSMTELPCLAALPAVGQMDATTLNQQCALLSGLYASTPYLSEHVQNYRALFATPACTGALPLPELDIT